MDPPVRLGVLALQGAFAEHREALRRALEDRGVVGEVVHVRRPEELATVDAIAMPGGESTTISRLLAASGLNAALVRRARDEDLPVLATCAGLILVASEGDRQVAGTDTRLLGLVDAAVDRNAFGRQRESFEVDVPLRGLDGGPFRAVFIRAPAVTRAWGRAEVVAEVDAGDGPRVVGVRQGNVLALAFHPELTDDVRVHAAFLDTVLRWKSSRERVMRIA